MAIKHTKTAIPDVDKVTCTDWNANHTIDAGTILRSATFVVAASDSEDTTNADYFCDGVADEVQINQAINDLPATGGSVCLMDGTYDIDASILMNKDNLTLIGQGRNTIILTDTAIIMVNCATDTNGQLIKNIYFNGVNTSACRAINLDAYHSKVIECWFYNCYYGVYVIENYNLVSGCSFQNGTNGIYISGGNNNILTNNIGYFGTALVYLSSGFYNEVSNNVGYRTTTVVWFSQYANVAVGNLGYWADQVVFLITRYCIATGNYGYFCGYCIRAHNSSYSTITGNAIYRATNRGIYLTNCSNCTIVGNTINDVEGDNAIYLDSNSNHCTITGNSIVKVDREGIYISGGDHNIISSNNIHNCSEDANNTYAGILLTGTSTYNVVSGNRVSADAANKHSYGIREAAVADDWNLLHGNILTDAVTTNLSSQGPNSVPADNIAP